MAEAAAAAVAAARTATAIATTTFTTKSRTHITTLTKKILLKFARNGLKMKILLFYKTTK